MDKLPEQVPTHKQPLDVLYINPGALKQVYQGLGSQYSAIELPSIAALLASYVRNKGYSIDLIDVPAFGLSPEQAARLALDHFEPQLIVMVVYGFQPSASTQNMPAAGATCRALKAINPDVKILMTGTHPSALPDQTLREEAVDFVCSGEGQDTILKAMQYLKGELNDIEKIPSLYYWDGDEVAHTASGGLSRDLDADMPNPVFDLLPMDKYRAHNWHCFDHIDQRQPYASIHTTLGCPYRCSFCCINAPFGKPSYRMWSPDTIIAQIDTLVQDYKVKNIKIVDEMFVLNKAHVMGICDRIIDRGYDLNIWAYARVDTVKEEFLAKMRKAGIRWLALGIESGSKHVRDGVEKGRFGYKEILEVVRKIQAAGIYVIGNYIFGLPDDTFQTMQETFELALEANCEFSNFYTAMAYPGSQLHRMAIQNGWELPSSWIGYSQHAYETHPLRTEALSAAEVLKFRDEAFIRFFSHPQYLSMVKDKFGEEVVRHIEKMLEVKLDRALFKTLEAA